MEKRALQTLTSAQIKEIVRRAPTETRQALSREFGVSTRTIRRIALNYGSESSLQALDDEEEANVDPAAVSPPKKQRKPQVNLDYKQRKTIIKRLNTGETIDDLAKEYGVSYRTVQRLWRYQDEYLAKINAVKESCGNLGMKRVTEESPLDRAVIEWYRNELIELGVDSVPGNTVRARALQLNKDLDGPRSFKASGGWLWNFKRRYALVGDVEFEDPLSSADEAVAADANAPATSSAASSSTRAKGGHHPKNEAKSTGFPTVKQEQDDEDENFVAIREQVCLDEPAESIGPEDAYKAATTLAKFVEASMAGDVEALNVVKSLRDRIFDMI